jgi:hypothetical protein
MEEELDLELLQLVVEVFDHQGNFQGEWAYDISRHSIEQWEGVDMDDFDQGKSLVRYLLLSRLKQHSFITWKLLTDNTCLGDFLSDGVADELVSEIPRLCVINAAVDKMYDCLSRLVLDEEIRIAH